MRNWRCLIHFPDGAERVRLVPGPGPVPESAEEDRPIIIKIDSEEGLWLVYDINTRVRRLTSQSGT